MDKKKKRKKSGGNNSLVFTNKMYVFLIPALLFFLILWIYPLLQLFYYSITDFNGINYNFNFVGLENFQRIFENGSMVNAIKNTLIYAVVVVLLSNLIGLGIAIALNTRIHFKGIFRKVLIFLLVGIANIIDVQVIGTGAVLRTAVIFFYISNEGVSLLENAGHLGLPIPEKIKTVLEQLHDRAEKEEE